MRVVLIFFLYHRVHTRELFIMIYWNIEHDWKLVAITVENTAHLQAKCSSISVNPEISPHCLSWDSQLVILPAIVSQFGINLLSMTTSPSWTKWYFPAMKLLIIGQTECFLIVQSSHPSTKSTINCRLTSYTNLLVASCINTFSSSSIKNVVSFNIQLMWFQPMLYTQCNHRVN